LVVHALFYLLALTKISGHDLLLFRGRVIQAYSETGTKFSDIQGLTALKEELMTFVRIMRDDEEGKRFRNAKFALPKVGAWKL
jgi:hypothetical protein